MVCVCRRWVWGGGGHARCGTDFDIFQAQGRLGEAEALYARAFAVGGAALGPRHPDVAVWCSNLAGLFQVRSFVCARARASLSASFLSPSLSLSASSFSLRFASPLCRPWGGPRGEDGGEVLSTVGSVARPIPRHIAMFGPASPARRIPSHASPLRSKAATTRPSRCSSGASRSERQEHVSRPARPAPSRPHPTAARSLARSHTGDARFARDCRRPPSLLGDVAFSHSLLGGAKPPTPLRAPACSCRRPRPSRGLLAPRSRLAPFFPRGFARCPRAAARRVVQQPRGALSGASSRRRLLCVATTIPSCQSHMRVSRSRLASSRRRS